VPIHATALGKVLLSNSRMPALAVSKPSTTINLPRLTRNRFAGCGFRRFSAVRGLKPTREITVYISTAKNVNRPRWECGVRKWGFWYCCFKMKTTRNPAVATRVAPTASSTGLHVGCRSVRDARIAITIIDRAVISANGSISKQRALDVSSAFYQRSYGESASHDGYLRKANDVGPSSEALR